MSRGKDDGKMMYSVLDKDEKPIFVTKNEKEAFDYLRKNYGRLRTGNDNIIGDSEGRDEEDRQEKLKALQDIQMDKHTAKDPELQKELIKRKQELQKTEGNQFAQAVQKAKAAGMKAGDKFKVGDNEYTLKDAIEMAGLQLEEFFSEEGDESEAQPSVEAQDEAEEINTELDRIKTLANIA